MPRPGWAPDPLMVGIRSPDGLVVGSCTSHPGVLGSIPKREEPGKTGAPCIKVPGSSRVPVMGRLVHTGLGSSSLVAHVLPYPPPPPCKHLCTRSCSNKHTHICIWEPPLDAVLMDPRGAALGQFHPGRKRDRTVRGGIPTTTGTTEALRHVYPPP
jgi:hypothetical protein